MARAVRPEMEDEHSRPEDWNKDFPKENNVTRKPFFCGKSHVLRNK
jgi:hypothetical protein